MLSVYQYSLIYEVHDVWNAEAWCMIDEHLCEISSDFSVVANSFFQTICVQIVSSSNAIDTALCLQTRAYSTKKRTAG